MSQGKRWCFTLNNYTEDEYESAKCFLLSESSFFILGKEQGDGGTPHIQGYCELKRRYRFSSLKAKISERSHLELARGTGEDNVNYCSKGGSFFQSGRLSNYRRRSEESRDRRPTRDELATSFVSSCDKHGVLSGCAQFAADNPGTFYYSGFNLLRNYWSLKSPPSRPDISVWWYYGPPGSGKSRRAFEELPEAYRKDARTKWYHGYMGQESCVIDDFGPNCIDIGRLLVWFDRYPCNVESKGGMVPLCVVKFIVTSNFSPEECFKDIHGAEHVQTPALLRRINVLEIL